MNDDDFLLRYSRHILLDEIGVEGQSKLCCSRVLLVGLGGLGSAAALYLNSSGIALTLADFDCVELSNLQRQIVHSADFLNQNKALSAQNRLQQNNPTAPIDPVCDKITAQNVDSLVRPCQVIVDCSDNFPTRYLLNRSALTQQKMLVSGSAIRWGGQLLALDFQQTHSPCYACLFPEQAQSEEERCATSGVFAPLVGVVGVLQAALTLKMLLGLENPPFFMQIDLKKMRFHRSQFIQDPACPVCHNS